MFFAGMEDEGYLKDRASFWNNVYGYNMSSINKYNQKLDEPLVDTLNQEAINTRSCPIFEIDIKTVKREELNFASKFSCEVTRDDSVNGFVGWFECFFTDCHLFQKLDTSPYAKYTHWKQTMFYFDKPFFASRGDVIDGNIAVKQNKKNHRELDIKIWATLKDKRGQEKHRDQKVFVMH